MALQHIMNFHCLFPPSIHNKLKISPSFAGITLKFTAKQSNPEISIWGMDCFCLSSKLHLSPSRQGSGMRGSRIRAQSGEKFKCNNGKEAQNFESSDSDEDDDDNSSARKVNMDDPYLMDTEERQEWRRKIREVISQYPDLEEEVDPNKKREQMQKLMAKYPLVVEEDDPDWPEDADGRGFSFSQFFDKITIKNEKDDDDENYDSENEIVWQDDDYIRPIKDISTADWEETVFKDFSPLIVLVHNRYKRPKENERMRDELEKAVHIIWNCRLPSPRCVAIDAIVEVDLASALKVSVFPEVIFTNAGKILYREKAIRTAEELSKIMAFFFYKAAKPPGLNCTGNTDELIPSVVTNSQTR